MDIDRKDIKVSDLIKCYTDNKSGVYAYDGKLNVRPEYQREYKYEGPKREAVIKSMLQNFPLNVMYWVKNGEDSYEVLDGQQRTISICQYVTGVFSVDGLYFKNQSQENKDKILNYSLLVYICEGSDQQRLDWFEIINIAGVKLNAQELLNANFSGPWLSDAKVYFSKRNGQGERISKNYIKGDPIDQVILEKALKWVGNDNIKEYMATHQDCENAEDLWNSFKEIIDWIDSTFIVVRKKEMQLVDWGHLYRTYGHVKVDSNKMEEEVKELMADFYVKNNKGIYEYVFDKNTKHLNVRIFDNIQKRASYERQDGICRLCDKKYKFEEMEADHITAWSKGGETIMDNCEMLCVKHNREKGNK